MKFKDQSLTVLHAVAKKIVCSDSVSSSGRSAAPVA